MGSSTAVSSGSTSSAQPVSAANAACSTRGASTNNPTDNATVVDGLGTNYRYTCTYNYNYDAATDIFATSYNGCLEYCDLRPNCVGVTYADATHQRNCHPKSGVLSSTPNTDNNGGLYAGIAINGANSGASWSTDLCSSSNSATYNGKPYGPDKLGKSYTVGCGQTNGGSGSTAFTDASGIQIGSQLPNILACLTYCSTITGCKGVTFDTTKTGQNDLNCLPYSAVGTVSTNSSINYASQQ